MAGHTSAAEIRDLLLHLMPRGSKSSRIFATSKYCWVRAFKASARPRSRLCGLPSAQNGQFCLFRVGHVAEIPMMHTETPRWCRR